MCTLRPVTHTSCSHITTLWHHCVDSLRGCQQVETHPTVIITRKLCVDCGGPRVFERRGAIAEKGGIKGDEEDRKCEVAKRVKNDVNVDDGNVRRLKNTIEGGIENKHGIAQNFEKGEETELKEKLQRVTTHGGNTKGKYSEGRRWDSNVVIEEEEEDKSEEALDEIRSPRTLRACPIQMAKRWKNAERIGTAQTIPRRRPSDAEAYNNDVILEEDEHEAKFQDRHLLLNGADISPRTLPLSVPPGRQSRSTSTSEPYTSRSPVRGRARSSSRSSFSSQRSSEWRLNLKKELTRQAFPSLESLIASSTEHLPPHGTSEASRRGRRRKNSTLLHPSTPPNNSTLSLIASSVLAPRNSSSCFLTRTTSEAENGSKRTLNKGVRSDPSPALLPSIPPLPLRPPPPIPSACNASTANNKASACKNLTSVCPTSPERAPHEVPLQVSPGEPSPIKPSSSTISSISTTSPPKVHSKSLSRNRSLSSYQPHQRLKKLLSVRRRHVLEAIARQNIGKTGNPNIGVKKKTKRDRIISPQAPIMGVYTWAMGSARK